MAVPPPTQQARTSPQGFWRKVRSLRVFRVLSDISGVIGLVSVLLIILLAIFAEWVAPYDPNAVNVANRLADPNELHWLGTDHLGRDLLSRIIFGARVALMVSIPAVVIAAVVGLILGLIAGFYGGLVESAILTLFDIVRSFPSLLLAIAVIALTGPSLTMVIVIMGLTSFPDYGRLIRAQTLKAKEEEFVTAARALGCNTPRIMVRHLMPNVIAPLFILMAMDIPVVITFEAGLSFVGLGVPPPTASWGTILREGYGYVRASPWMVVFGSVALVIATLGFTYFAEALRDTFDVKLRDR